MTTILISNRISAPQSGGAVQGGLAAALQVATEKFGACWIGSNGKQIREEVSAHDAINIRAAGAGRMVTVEFPRSAYRNFYNGMANSVIWPILHDRADLMHFTPDGRVA